MECVCTLRLISVQRRLLVASTVLDNCAWAVSNVHVDLPTLANWRLCNVYAQKRLSPRLTSMLHVLFFSQYLLPPFIACIELVSLGSEATIQPCIMLAMPLVSTMTINLVQEHIPQTF